jgi:hypothetical protein
MKAALAILMVIAITMVGDAYADDKRASTARQARTNQSARKSEKPDIPRQYDDRDRSGWYPRDANQLKFGSKLWFEQMEAEGRFGGLSRESD